MRGGPGIAPERIVFQSDVTPERPDNTITTTWLSPEELEEIRRKYPTPANAKRPFDTSPNGSRPSRIEVEYEIAALEPDTVEAIELEIAAHQPHRAIAERYDISGSALRMIASQWREREIQKRRAAATGLDKTTSGERQTAPAAPSAVRPRYITPSKYTPEQRATVESLLRQGRPRQEIADAAQVPYTTVLSWAKEMRKRETVPPSVASPMGRKREPSEGDEEMAQRTSPEVKAEALRLLEDKRTVKEIAGLTGVSEVSIYAWRKELEAREKREREAPKATDTSPKATEQPEQLTDGANEPPKEPERLTPEPQEAEKAPVELTTRPETPEEGVQGGDAAVVGLGETMRTEPETDAIAALKAQALLDAIDEGIAAGKSPEVIARQERCDVVKVLEHAMGHGRIWNLVSVRWEAWGDTEAERPNAEPEVKNSPTPDPAPSADPEGGRTTGDGSSENSPTIAPRPEAPQGAEDGHALRGAPSKLDALSEWMQDATWPSLADRRLALRVIRDCAGVRAGSIDAGMRLVELLEPLAERVLMGD